LGLVLHLAAFKLLLLLLLLLIDLPIVILPPSSSPLTGRMISGYGGSSIPGIN
jgi:hypothetical protein